MGASFSKAQSSSTQGAGQGVQFPTQFLNQLSNVIGYAPNEGTLLAGLPQSQSLFGRNPVGVFGPAGGGGGYGATSGGSGYPYGSPYGPSGSGGYSPDAMASNPYASGPGAYAPPGYGQPPSGPAQGAAPPSGASGPSPAAGGTAGLAPGTFSYGDITGMLAQINPADMRYGASANQELNKGMAALGIAPNSNLTIPQIQQIAAWEQQTNPGSPYSNYLSRNLPGLLQQYGNLQNPANQTGFTSSGSNSSLNAMQGLQNLGIGQAVTPNEAPTIGSAPTVTSPQAAAAQMNIAPQGFQQYENQIYQQQFAPIQQQQTIQNAIQNQQLNSDLASRGLASSAAGQGQMQLQKQQQTIQLNNASVQAANNASVQAFGAQYGQAQQNAQLQQQTALQNAGLDQQAQVTNATNILTGNIQNATAYLQTIGLNTTQASNAASEFLSTLGLNEQDLSRMDSVQQQNVGLLLNNWLQQASLASGAGVTSRSTGGAQSTSLGQSAGISG